MNKRYSDLLSALNRQTMETNTKFSELTKDISSIKETGDQMRDRLTHAIGQIDSLKLSKANSSDLDKMFAETVI